MSDHAREAGNFIDSGRQDTDACPYASLPMWRAVVFSIMDTTMKHFVDRFGPWAVVTGASSGIGKAFARELAPLGMNLVLVARREERLRILADDLQRRHSITVRIVAADLAREDFLPVIARATDDLAVGLLVNNAGVATTGRFLEHDLAAELALLHTNNRAPLMLAHHFGRLMRPRRRGGMIFVSSMLAFTGVPWWTSYAASKAHNLVLAEGLARDLRKDGIAVLALCPGPTRSELWPPGSRLIFPMRPATVARRALKRIGRRTVVIPGVHNWIGAFSTRLLPRSWNAAIWGWVVGWMLKGVSRG
jgi:short-subunit dehydrogenase